MPITNIEKLEEILSRPSEELINTMTALEGDIVILGVGGKIGPSLARMAKRATDAAGKKRRVIGVSRFTDGNLEAELQSAGIETIRCDLLEKRELEALPDAPNVVFMAGMKFGSSENHSLTWALNSYLPGEVCQKYSRSRIVIFSTGNIYGLTPLAYGGAVETDIPNPIGEYAISALGRERIFEHFSRTSGLLAAICRLNYAAELRYGVLVDIAEKVMKGEAVDLSMGNANVIFQGDANNIILRTFEHVSSPPFIINITGPETLSVRRVAEQFGQLMNKEVKFCGTESADGILNNSQLSHSLFGYPRVSIYQLITWTAGWIMQGGVRLGKSTHFETRHGQY